MRNAILVLVGATLLATMSVALTERPTAQAQPASVPVPIDDFTAAPTDRTDEVLDAVGRLSDRLDTILNTLDQFETRIAALESDMVAIKSAPPTRATTAACACDVCQCDPCRCSQVASDPNWPPENPPFPQPIPQPVSPPVVAYQQVCENGVCSLVPVSVTSSATSSYASAGSCDDCVDGDGCDLLAPVNGQPIRNGVRAVGRVVSDLRVARLERLDGNVGPIRQGMIERRAARIAARRGW